MSLFVSSQGHQPSAERQQQPRSLLSYKLRSYYSPSPLRFWLPAFPLCINRVKTQTSKQYKAEQQDWGWVVTWLHSACICLSVVKWWKLVLHCATSQVLFFFFLTTPALHTITCRCLIHWTPMCFPPELISMHKATKCNFSANMSNRKCFFFFLFLNLPHSHSLTYNGNLKNSRLNCGMGWKEFERIL